MCFCQQRDLAYIKAAQSPWEFLFEFFIPLPTTPNSCLSPIICSPQTSVCIEMAERGRPRQREGSVLAEPVTQSASSVAREEESNKKEYESKKHLIEKWMKEQERKRQEQQQQRDDSYSREYVPPSKYPTSGKDHSHRHRERDGYFPSQDDRPRYSREEKRSHKPRARAASADPWSSQGDYSRYYTKTAPPPREYECSTDWRTPYAKVYTVAPSTKKHRRSQSAYGDGRYREQYSGRYYDDPYDTYVPPAQPQSRTRSGSQGRYAKDTYDRYDSFDSFEPSVLPSRPKSRSRKSSRSRDQDYYWVNETDRDRRSGIPRSRTYVETR